MKTIELGGLVLPIKATPAARLTKFWPLVQNIDSTGRTADGMVEAAEALAEAVYYGIREAGGEVSQEFVYENIDNLNYAYVFRVFYELNKLPESLRVPMKPNALRRTILLVAHSIS